MKVQTLFMQIWKILGMARLMSSGKHVCKTSVHTLAELQTSVGRCSCNGYQGNLGRGKICMYISRPTYIVFFWEGSLRHSKSKTAKHVFWTKLWDLKRKIMVIFSKQYLPMGRDCLESAKWEAIAKKMDSLITLRIKKNDKERAGWRGRWKAVNGSSV